MPDDEKYCIGYRKPPKHTQFRKGQSGNPKGRPRVNHDVSALVKKELVRRTEITEGGQRKRVSRLRAMMRTLIEKAARGDVPSIKLVLEQLGKAQATSSAPIEQEVTLDLEALREAADRSVETNKGRDK